VDVTCSRMYAVIGTPLETRVEGEKTVIVSTEMVSTEIVSTDERLSRRGHTRPGETQ
jgi:hypothetical protein